MDPATVGERIGFIGGTVGKHHSRFVDGAARTHAGRLLVDGVMFMMRHPDGPSPAVSDVMCLIHLSEAHCREHRGVPRHKMICQGFTGLSQAQISSFIGVLPKL